MMSGIIELCIIFVVVAAAAAFATRSIIKAFRKKRPSCCSEDGIPKKVDK
jgi:ribulose kinase